MRILETCVPFLLIGIFQWFILRRRLVNPKRWIWASFIGLWIGAWIGTTVAGFSVDSGLSQVTTGLIAGAILGAALGTAQWLILRQSVNLAGLWILANIIGLSAGTAGAWPVISNIHDDSIGIIIYLVIALLVLTSIYGVVTGFFLFRLLDQPIEKPSAIPSTL
jgi:uncharacterized MnhB-related membrane protein